MKKLLTLFAMLTLFVSMMAQTTPLNYQAVLRDPANNELVRNQAVNAVVSVPVTADINDTLFNGTVTTNSDGMLNLPMSCDGVDWMNVYVINAVFTYGDKKIEIETPVTPVPYAFHTDGSYLTTEHIVDYITRENIDGSQINGDDIDTIYRALKRNAQLHDGMRDSIVNYIMKNYEKAKEIGYHYLFLITATDLNQFYQEGRTIDQEVKDSIYSMAKQFLKENRDMLVELAKYYAETATAAEVNQLYNELLSNSTANAKIRELLYGYFDAYLIRKGLYCDHATLCDIYNTIINNGAPTFVCPSWTSSSFTPELIDGNYKATLTFAGDATSTTVSGTYIATVSGVPGVETAIPGNGISVNGYSVILNVPASSLTTMEGTGDKIEFKIKLTNSNDQCTTQPVSTGTYEQGQFGCVTLGQVTVETSDDNLVVTMPLDFYNEADYRQAYSGCNVYVNEDIIYTVTGTNAVSIINGTTESQKVYQCVIPISELLGETSIVVEPFVNIKCKTAANYVSMSKQQAYQLPTIDPCATDDNFTATAFISSDGLIAELACNMNMNFNWTNRGFSATAYDANNVSKEMNAQVDHSTCDQDASINADELTNFVPKTVKFTVYGDGENCEPAEFTVGVEVCPQFGEPHVTATSTTLTYTIPFSPVTTTFTQNDVTITIHQNGQDDIVETFTSFNLDNTNGEITLTADVRNGVNYSNASYDVVVAMSNDCAGSMTNNSYSELCPSFGTTTLCKNMNDGATVETEHSVTIRTPIENYDPSIGTVRYDITFYVSEGTSTPGVRYKSFNVTEIANGYCTLTVTKSDWLGGTQSVPMNPTTTWNVTPVLIYTNTSLCGASQVSGTASGTVQYNNIPACNN
jgi:hypothetical protein